MKRKWLFSCCIHIILDLFELYISKAHVCLYLITLYTWSLPCLKWKQNLEFYICIILFRGYWPMQQSLYQCSRYASPSDGNLRWLFWWRASSEWLHNYSRHSRCHSETSRIFLIGWRKKIAKIVAGILQNVFSDNWMNEWPFIPPIHIWIT